MERFTVSYVDPAYGGSGGLQNIGEFSIELELGKLLATYGRANLAELGCADAAAAACAERDHVFKRYFPAAVNAHYLERSTNMAV